MVIPSNESPSSSNTSLSDDRNNQVEVPGLIGVDNPQRYNANLTTAPQEFLDNQTLPYSQGKVVGGSSIINGLCWTRGSQDDIDAWETLGNPGWSWDGLLPYFLKVSHNATSASGRDTEKQVQVRELHIQHQPYPTGAT